MTECPVHRISGGQVHLFPRRPALPNGCEAELVNQHLEWQERRRERRRWLLAAAVVLAVYAGLTAWWLCTSRAVHTPGPPTGMMFIELAPAPASPVSESDLPPAPEPSPEIAPSPKSKARSKPKSQLPVAESEVALPEISSEPEVEPDMETESESVDVPPEKSVERPPSSASAPAAAPTENERVTASNQGIDASMKQVERAPRWRDQLLMALNKAKRYPVWAKRLRQEGTSHLHFVMNRDGEVLEYSIARSSGYELLDQETLDLIKRAQPLPKPPQQVEGETLEFVVGIEFFLRGAQRR